MRIELQHVEHLRFPDGAPVRAASGVARFGSGHLVAQDDATHAAWFRDGVVSAVRVLPAVQGLEVFGEASGTKHLKPDLEAACEVVLDGDPAVLLLGSGSDPARMRSSLLTLRQGEPRAEVADLTALYGAVADALSVEAEVLNLEGACVLGDRLRWFHRGLPSAGFPSGSVDLPLAEVVAAAAGRADPATITVASPVEYDLGEVAGVGLALTDAVAMPDGSIVASAVAEDSPNARDDGRVVGSALVRLHGDTVTDLTSLPEAEGAVSKVEGLMLARVHGRRAYLLAVVDVDDPRVASLAMRLELDL